MTQPSSPLTPDLAQQHLLDALGANYAGPTDAPALTRALQLDAVRDATGVRRLRPWATAARLIRLNTEYELSGELAARIDRKLAALEAQQAGADVAGGIQGAVASLGSETGPGGGPVPIQVTW